MNVLLAGVHFPGKLHELNDIGNWALEGLVWEDVEEFFSNGVPVITLHSFVLTSGETSFLDQVMGQLDGFGGSFLFAVVVHFEKWQRRDLLWRYKRWALDQLYPGLLSSTLRHANFGGVTSAVHYICYHNLGVSGGIMVPCVLRTLQHILNAA
jgi:hypothetical protein